MGLPPRPPTVILIGRLFLWRLDKEHHPRSLSASGHWGPKFLMWKAWGVFEFPHLEFYPLFAPSPDRLDFDFRLVGFKGNSPPTQKTKEKGTLFLSSNVHLSPLKQKLRKHTLCLEFRGPSIPKTEGKKGRKKEMMRWRFISEGNPPNEREKGSRLTPPPPPISADK